LAGKTWVGFVVFHKCSKKKSGNQENEINNRTYFLTRRKSLKTGMKLNACFSVLNLPGKKD
jgi:hypothetical protein